jgi:hypothetical protein
MMIMTMDESALGSVRPKAGYFYVYMAAACATVASLGFAPTYWLPVMTGAFKARPVIHVHGIIFFSWTLFFLAQTSLATAGHIAWHRTMGMVGISFATAMTIFGFLAAINQMQSAAALGLDDAGKAFAIVSIGSILFFAIVFILAITNVRRPEWHKRLMLLAAISILDAPIARWFATFLAPPGSSGPPPVAADIPPFLLTFILLVVAIVFDWRTRGRPHPAYLFGGSALVALKVLQVPLSATPLWHSVAGWILALAG